MTSIRYKPKMRLFRCTVCGSKYTAPKLIATKRGHRKRIWCYRCKAEQLFIQKS